MSERRPSPAAWTRCWAFLALACLGLLIGPEILAAQVETGTREMRHFWHVFIAYAAAWILILGWIVSIVRRLRRVEERLH